MSQGACRERLIEMPLIWKRGENPYRINYFGILELGPNAQPQLISHKRADLLRKIRGGQHVVDGRPVTEAEINEAESRLLEASGWAGELLLVHPVPGGDVRRLRQICVTLAERTTPPQAPQQLRLTNVEALAPLLPEPSPEDIAWPEWDEFGVPGPDSQDDCQCDVQFDM